ncbi:MAG: prolipoprotein diacylglyceryl transferase, partial [Candidatus Muproteobacteria bacterium RIFCSPHIGHO2_01_FULL_65_16]
MLRAPDIDPVAIHLGPLAIHWYGLMYVVGFGLGWWLGVYRARRPGSGWRPEELSDVLFYIALGVILGGRLGYVLFYNLAHYLSHPLEVFYIWTGGMSFHGGLIGVAVALLLYARKTGRAWFAVTDFLAPLAPAGLGPGRIGNFINQELWGRVTDLPWGMVFRPGGPEPRHPTQLYEAALEGVALFVILWLYS